MGLLDRLRGSFVSKNRTAKEWYDLAVQLATEHKLNDTHEALKKSLASTPQTPELCVMIALALEGLNDVDTAIAALKRATQMAPRSPQAQLQLGQLLLKHKRTQEALKPLREAVHLTDFAADACLKFAAALDAENEVEEALAQCHVAARGAPDNLEALRTLGRLQQKYGHGSGAIRSWRRVLQLAPNDLTAMTALGILLSERGKHHDALSLLSTVVRARPDVPEAYSDIALALSRSGSHDAAMQAIRQALTLRPKSPQLLLNLAAVQKESGQIEAAINTYWEVVGLAPDWPTAHFNVGIALKERGDLNGARTALMKAAKLAPQNQEIQAALSELEGTKPAIVPPGRHDDAPDRPPQSHTPLPPAPRKVIERSSVPSRASESPPPPLPPTTQDLRLPRQGSIPEPVTDRGAAQMPTPKRAYRVEPHLTDDLGIDQTQDDVVAEVAREEPTKKKVVFPEQAKPPELPPPVVPPPMPEIRRSQQPSNKSITGEIEIFPLTEVLEFLKVHRSTGVLLISSDLGHGELRMREGNLVGGHAPNTKDLLSLLVSTGQVKDSDVALRAKNTSPDKAAAELVDQGLINEDTFREACIAQIQSALMELISWKKGDFTFGADRSGTLEGAVSIDTRGALMDVLRKMDESRK